MLRIAGFTLVSLASLAFALRIVERVIAGEWLQDYYSAKLVHWTYGSAFIVLIGILVVALIGGIIHLYGWLRRRKDHQASLESNRRGLV